MIADGVTRSAHVAPTAKISIETRVTGCTRSVHQVEYRVRLSSDYSNFRESTPHHLIASAFGGLATPLGRRSGADVNRHS